MFSLFRACTQRAPSISSMLFLPSWKGKKHACLRVYHISGSSFKQSAKHRMYACCINLHAIVNLLLHLQVTLRLSNLQWAKIGCVSVAYTCVYVWVFAFTTQFTFFYFISLHCVLSHLRVGCASFSLHLSRDVAIRSFCISLKQTRMQLHTFEGKNALLATSDVMDFMLACIF